MIRAGIIGGAGYTGGELIRLLLRHPQAEITFVQSKSNAGNPLHQIHSDLAGDTSLLFSADHHYDVDVLFLCAGHGEARKFLQQNEVPASVRIIDLSHDFRLKNTATAGGRTFIYGLPELNRDLYRNNKNIDIANPGCFATAIQLGLLPLAAAGLLSDVYTTGITGSTGAGQGLSATSHFSWRANNIQAYKTLTHQHLGEIGESLMQLQPSHGVDISFVPWRGDFPRGIFISSTIRCELSESDITNLFETYYATQPFTHVIREAVHLKQVVNTNKCLIQTEKVGSKQVVHSVQNMNLLFGLEETTGLNLKASYF